MKMNFVKKFATFAFAATVSFYAQAKTAGGPTANQIKAGDFNGNGKLDNADYQSLRELLKEKGLL